MKSVSKDKYVMVTHEFGEPVYIAPSGSGSIKTTGIKEEAEQWNYEDTISAAKLPYHKAVTGYKELTFEKI